MGGAPRLRRHRAPQSATSGVGVRSLSASASPASKGATAFMRRALHAHVPDFAQVARSARARTWADEAARVAVSGARCAVALLGACVPTQGVLRKGKMVGRTACDECLRCEAVRASPSSGHSKCASLSSSFAVVSLGVWGFKQQRTRRAVAISTFGLGTSRRAALWVFDDGSIDGKVGPGVRGGVHSQFGRNRSHRARSWTSSGATGTIRCVGTGCDKVRKRPSPEPGPIRLKIRLGCINWCRWRADVHQTPVSVRPSPATPCATPPSDDGSSFSGHPLGVPNRLARPPDSDPRDGELDRMRS